MAPEGAQRAEIRFPFECQARFQAGAACRPAVPTPKALPPQPCPAKQLPRLQPGSASVATGQHRVGYSHRSLPSRRSRGLYAELGEYQKEVLVRKVIHRARTEAEATFPDPPPHISPCKTPPASEETLILSAVRRGGGGEAGPAVTTSARLRRGFPHRWLLRPSREAAGSGPSSATRGPHCGVPTRLEVTRYRTAAARSPPRRAAHPLPTPAGSRQRGSAPRPKIVPRKDAQSQKGSGRSSGPAEAPLCPAPGSARRRTAAPGGARRQGPADAPVPGLLLGFRAAAQDPRLLAAPSPSDSSQAAAGRTRQRSPAAPAAPPAPQLHPLYTFGMFNKTENAHAASESSTAS